MRTPTDKQRDEKFKMLCDMLPTEAVVKLLQALCHAEKNEIHDLLAQQLAEKEHQPALKVIMLTSAFMLTDILREKNKQAVECN